MNPEFGSNNFNKKNSGFSGSRSSEYEIDRVYSDLELAEKLNEVQEPKIRMFLIYFINTRIY